MTDGTKTIIQVITHSRCMSTISARPSKPRVKTLHSASCTRIFKTGPLVTPLKMHTPFFHLCSHRPLQNSYNNRRVSQSCILKAAARLPGKNHTYCGWFCLKLAAIQTTTTRPASGSGPVVLLHLVEVFGLLILK